MKRIGIVGRTNVGKSTLFNRLIKQGKSITSPLAGTTRDYISSEFDLEGNSIELIDFGGFDFESNELIEKNVQNGILKSLESLDLILFVVDGKTIVGDQEKKIAQVLRKAKRPVILVVNKIEKAAEANNIYDFYSLGFSDLLGVSALANSNLSELLELMRKRLKLRKNKPNKNEDQKIIKIAIIGKPNVGKSSLFNVLYGSERSIVTEIAGTTRDSIDAKIKIGSREYLFIDTAGLRKKTKIYQRLDKDSSYKAIDSINRADIIMYLLDVSSQVTSYDIKLINYAWNKGKSILVVVNKWDIKPADMTEKKYQELVTVDHSIFKKFPFVFVSAVRRRGIEKIQEEIRRLENISEIAVKTSKLNSVIRKIILKLGVINLKVFYTVQTGKKPVEIALFINNKKHFKLKYIEFIESQLRQELGLLGVPIKIVLRERDR